MPQLIDLLHSLTEVIIRYHDTHVSAPLVNNSDSTLLAKAYKDKSKEIIGDKETAQETLAELITKCTISYPKRKHLLNYFLHEVLFLNTMLTHPASFTPDELSKYKTQLSQMLIDFKQLLDTTKSKIHRVSYSLSDDSSPTIIALDGLVKDGYFEVGHFCDSGTLLNEIVMSRVHFSMDHKEKEKPTDIALSAFISELCDNHQNSLLAVEKLELQRQLDLVKREKAAQALELEKAGAKLVKQVEASAALTLELEQTRSKVRELEEAASKKVELVSQEVQTESGPDELLVAREKIKVQETTISGLRADLAQKAPPVLPLFRNPAFYGLYNPLLFNLAQPRLPAKKPSSESLDEPTSPSPY